MRTEGPAPTAWRPIRDRAELTQALTGAGLLLGTGVPGLYGHGAAFEAVRGALEASVSTLTRADGAISVQFPPLLAREQLETLGYLGSFPQLAGTVFGFSGGDAEARAQAALAAAHGDWSEHQSMTELMLTPAGCYPLYPALGRQGPLAPGGVFVDMGATWIFRREPSEDPARRQAFRQHELVRAGTEAEVLAWRERWVGVVLDFLTGLGLTVAVDDANDPFFGRGGRMLAANQRAQKLKLEFLCEITDPDPTALASSNLHGVHFGELYDIRVADGGVAHTTCLGIGQERVVLALFNTHGLEIERWPAAVRDTLGL